MYNIRSVLLAVFTLSCLALPCHAEQTEQAAETDKSEHYVTVQTDLGPMLIELYPQQAPISVANFLAYVDSGFYEGTIFHRVIPGFVVQGGGLTFDFNRKETLDPIKNESDNGLKNTYLTLSMARLNRPDTATSQFFINLKHNESLDGSENKPGYAVFGKVIAGENVVRAIVSEPRGIFRAYPDAPNAAVRILKTERGNHYKQAQPTSKLKDMIAQ
ncbi:peptidylprolyl isomerase [Gilvimarinus sp. SDUM040013]|uniref:Peptidyl-prolyl cis-trans isomerase n=1 Tax=Gilvimarinus gilvus TaxID=3058038 RepID=A0ABU4RXQ7_9GAMM|nr:peptidylprolyl isomerase [Gilvimarinus sp. SDUM040013]MDO3386423.1 peptidylprolyl isomerase [Gilvimarinus sp. SDUM040013]MDX6849689.1 peptidylprolyl isomerase [Gilvimarinus sp. SDUM040013]